MKERPILFSTSMVQAIMDGRKTMTRRIVKGIALEWLKPDMFTPEYVALPENELCPYGQSGDLLWVRETFTAEDSPFEQRKIYWYKADTNNDAVGMGWKPSIHMPKAAARIWLRVTDVRVERLQDISVEDITSEGIRIPVNNGSICWQLGFENNAMSFMPEGYFLRHDTGATEKDVMFAHWAELWCKINGRSSWDLNPYVWVVSFEKVTKEEK